MSSRAIPGRPAGLFRCMFQPQAMRWRGVGVLTNTPPRRAQSQPGGMQGITLVEPLLAKAARKLGIDQVAIRRINAPEGKAQFGPLNASGMRPYATSAFVKEALDKGARCSAGRREGARAANASEKGPRRRRRVSTFFAGSVGFDGLFVIKPDGRMYIQSGIGNLGTESMSDYQPRHRRDAGHALGEGRVDSGAIRRKHLPWSCVSGGSQTTHAMTQGGARGGDRRHREAAGDRGEVARRDAGRLRGGERAGAAQGWRRRA